VSVVDQLRMMHSYNMHISTSLLSNIAMTMMQNCKDLFGGHQQYEILVYNADSLFLNKEHKKAEVVYRKALSWHKSMPKNLKSSAISPEIDLLHVKFRIYECCMIDGNEDSALEALLRIEERQRSVKVNYALAKLYQARHLRRNSINCYKEVLRSCPLALDCAVELLRLGEHPNVVISIMNVGCNIDWLPSYIKAHAFVISRDFSKAAVAFDVLHKSVTLNRNLNILSDLAYASYMAEDQSAALQHYKSLHMQDKFWLRGMDLYACILYEEKMTEELDKLSTEIFSASELHSEPWVVMGYQAITSEEFTKSVYMAAKANQLDMFSVQAFLLKAAGLAGLGEVQKALVHSREAITLAPHRLDCYSKLVALYMTENRNNEALTVAKSAFETIGPTPGTYVLCALAMMPEPTSLERAAKLVERALSLDPNHRSAVEMKSSILYRQEKYTDAIKFLKSATQRFGSSSLHCILGDCYFKLSKLVDAVDHYNIALSLNPVCKDAKDGLSKVNKSDRSEFDSEQNTSLEREDEERMTTGSTWPHDNPWF
uniref:Anaphase-promoting complex subunit 7 n=1 Tax=Ciona savignyi TaxID=51511 RepID=H2YD25_CIOSA